MLGLKHKTVKLVPHCYKWKYLFQQEVITLRRTLNNHSLHVEHVGSTALKNILAKPILDMMIPCDDLSIIKTYTDKLERLGYELVTNAESYVLFVKGSEEAYTHHLTFTSPEGQYWKETIQFRDYLLLNPLVAKAYETEKKELATQYPDSRRNYTANKARFIQAVLRDVKEAVASVADKAKYSNLEFDQSPAMLIPEADNKLFLSTSLVS